MRFVDEYRDPAAARALVAQITALAGADSFKFMEVCGGHTHTIYRHGIEHVLPPSVELVHGPGCPVCVIPMGRVDDAMYVAKQPGVIFTSFGDMMRVPGSQGNLLKAKAEGADIRFVYSPLDALRVAVDNPGREVVFFAVGFETTAPSTALTLLQARPLGVAHEMGFHVPRDISIIAWDDSPFCQVVHPPLSAVTRDVPQLGARACRRLLELIDHGVCGDLELPYGHFTPRGSTAKAPAIIGSEVSRSVRKRPPREQQKRQTR